MDPRSGQCVGSIRRRGLVLIGAVLLATIDVAGGGISSISPYGASATLPLNITGTGFDTTAGNNLVTFSDSSGVDHQLAAASVTTLDAAKGVRRLTLKLPDMPVGAAGVRVRNTVTGETIVGPSIQVITIQLPATAALARGATQVPIRIVGSPNALFTGATTRASFGAGVTVHSTVVESPTVAVATVSVSATAALGARSVGIVAPTHTGLGIGLFTVTEVGPPNRAPAANANGPYSATLGEAIAFSSAGSNDPDQDPLVYAWSFGDGSTSTAAAPTHTYANAGDYTVSLTVDDRKGGVHTATSTATVRAPNAPPVASITPAGQTIRLPDSATLAGAVSDDGLPASTLTAEWTKVSGEGAVTFGNASAAATTASFSVPGTYVLRLTANDSALSSSAEVTLVVRAANRPPDASAGGPYAGEAGVAVQFSAAGSTDPDGDALSYAWNFGDGASSHEQKPAHVYAQDGIFHVTLTVTDTEAASDTATLEANIAVATDRAPPVVTVSGPKEALPGAQLTMAAEAFDNVGVQSVTLDVNGDDAVKLAAAPYQRVVSVPEFAAPGATLKINATARDAAGNIGTGFATVTVVAVPDTDAPTVVVRAPTHAAPGAILQVAAAVIDNAAIDTVTLSVGGTQIALWRDPPFEATYTIPETATVGSTVTFSAHAIDTSDNRATASASVEIVQTPDTAPPTVTLSAPSTAQAGTTVPVTALAADDSGVASVAFFVDGARIASLINPPYDAVVTIPPGVPAGSRVRVEARALDFTGLQALASQSIDILATGEGVLTGEVYDDVRGLALEGALVTLAGSDARGVPYSQSAVSDQTGRYVIHATEGSGAIRITKPGWSGTERVALIKAGTAIELVDARLTSAGATAPVAALAGGTVTGDTLAFLRVWQREVSAAEDPSLGSLPSGSGDVRLTIPAGALTSNTIVTLTPVSRQSPAGLFPVGWTPAAILDIGPHGTALAGGATLVAPNPLNLQVGTSLVFTQWDEQARAWRALAASPVANRNDPLLGTIFTTGQFAWIAADTVPEAPPQPAPGDLVNGVAATLVPQGVTAIVDPQPKILFYKPDVKSDVRGTLTTTTGVPLSSGTIVEAKITESYWFVSDARVHLEPTVQDVVLYQIPGGSSAIMAAGFPVSPSLTFEPLSFDHGVITVELRAPEEAVHEIELIGADGGSVMAPTGQRLDLLTGSTAESVPIEVRPLTLQTLGVTVPPGFEFVDGATLSFAGMLSAPATFSIARPAQVADDDLFVLTRLQELDGQTRFVLVGLGAVTNDRIVGRTLLAGTDVTFAGVEAAGRYVFLRAANPLAFAAGIVTGAAGAVFTGALVSSNTLPIVALSQATGRYIAALALGAMTLTARDLQRTDRVSVQGTTSTPRQVLPLDLALAARPPTITSVTPVDGAVNIALGDPVVIRFSSPIDPATATLQSVQLTSTSGIVLGALALTANNTIATFRPVDAFQPNTTYTLTLSQSIKDPFGRSLPSAFVAGFTSLDTVAPPPPAAGSLTASIPGLDGKTTITATQGTAGAHDTVSVKNLTKKTLTPVVVDANGGFLVMVQAAPTDKLQIVITDSAGNETTVAVPAFRLVNADGSVSESVGPEGAHVVGPGDVAVDVPAGAFPNGAIVTLKPIAEASFPFQLNDEQRTAFTYVGGIALDLGGQTPERYLNLSIPATEADTIDQQWLVAQPSDVLGEIQLSMIDTAKLIGQRVTTSSAPCPGVTGGGLYGFVKSKRFLGINYGQLDLVPERLVVSIQYPPLVSGFALPVSAVSLQNAQTFCLPSITGRVTVAENAVRLGIGSRELTPVDREIIARNTTRGTELHIPRDVTEYTLTVDGDEADRFDVHVKDVGGNEQRFNHFRQNAGTAGSVAVGINPAQLLASDRSVTIHNTSRKSIFRSPLAAGRSVFTVEGTAADSYSVSITGSTGVERSIPASGFEFANGSAGSAVIRLNVDQIKVVVAEIRITNVTRGSESVVPQVAAGVKLSVAGGPTDTYTLTVVDILGGSRDVSFTKVTPAPPLDAGNLVVRAVPFSIDPTAQEIANANQDDDGDGFLNGYERRVGTNPNDSASRPNADADGDSCTDAVERSRGTDPADANSRPPTCPAIVNPPQDPSNTPVTGRGRSKVELVNKTTQTTLEIPPALIKEGGFEFAFTGNPSDEFWIYVYYEPVGGAGPPPIESERIPTLRLIVRDRLTGGIVKTVESFAPAKGELLGFGRLSDDPGPPMIESGPPRFDAVDPLAPLSFTFSEPIDRTTLTTATFIVERSINATEWRRVDGTLTLSPDGRRVTFKAAIGLGLGQEYRFRFAGIKDLAGKALLADTVPFATFAPKRICPDTQPSCVASFRTQLQPDTFRRVQDFAVVRKTEKVEVGGEEVQRLLTTLVGVTQGTNALDVFGSELIAVDVTEPSAAVQRGTTHLGRRQQRLSLLRDVTFKMRPESAGAPQMTFKGDIALTTQFNSTLSAVNFVDVTNLAQPGGFADAAGVRKSAGKPLLRFSQSGSLADISAKGTYSATGYAKGVAALPHSTGYAAFVAAAEFGLMMVDIGRNTPDVPPAERQKEPMFPGDYVDVIAVGDQLLAANRSQRLIELFDINLTPLASSDVLPDRPRRILSVPEYGIDSNNNGIVTPDEVRHLLFVAGDSCGTESDPSGACAASVQILDVTDLTSMRLIGRIPTPGAVFDLDVDPVHKRLYAVGRRGPNPNAGEVFFIIDLSGLTATGSAGNLIDNDGDINHWDDRIVWHKLYPDAAPARPAVPDQTYVYSVKFDRERGLAYVGTAWGFDFWTTRDNCCDVGVEMTAERDPAPVGPRPELIRRERLAIEEGIRRGLAAAQQLCVGLGTIASDPGTPARQLTIADWLNDADDRNRLSILEQGSGSCLWKGPNGSCDSTYQPGLSDHDFEVFIPGFVAPNLRRAEEDPNDPFAKQHPLVKCTIKALNDQFEDEEKNPRKIVVTSGGQTFEMEFDDVTFFAVPKGEFERARLNVLAPVSDSGSDSTGDLGLGRQQLLLKWLLEGEYVSIPATSTHPGSVGPGGQNLLAGRSLTLILDQLTKLEFLPRFEGFEWALLQEFNLIKSKAYLRVKGASQPESAFHGWYIKQLHDAGKAGIRAALARMTWDQQAQNQVLNITRSAYQADACVQVVATTAPESWLAKPCTSFEEYIVAAAVKDYLARRQSNSPLLFDVATLLQLHRFYRVKSDLEQIPSEAEADTFIAEVARFLAKVQVETRPLNCDAPYSSPACYSSIPSKHQHVEDRAFNLNEVEKKRLDLLKNGSIHVVPRLTNASFKDAQDVELRMYRNKGAQPALVKTVRVSVPSGTEQFRRYEVGSLDPPQDDETREDRAQTDESHLVKHPTRQEEFLLGDKKNSELNPPVPLDGANVSYGAHWVSFAIDLPEKKLKESNRQNNVGGFFYYVLDRSVDVPIAPVTGATPPLPIDDPKLLAPSTECDTPPKLLLTQSANNDRIRVNIMNTSTETLTAVRVCSNAAGTCVLVGTIAGGKEASIDIPFQKSPTDATIESLATATAVDSHGHGVALTFTDQLLNVASPIAIAFYDATPLAGPLHPFSRYRLTHDAAGEDTPIHGAITDGTPSAVRVAISGLKPGATAQLTLSEAGPLKTTDGLGELVSGELKGREITVTSDLLGRAEVFYTPPSVFVRPSMSRYDFHDTVRQVLVSVHQQDVGSKTAPVSLRRPPVFLVHGLFGSIHVWKDFQPLVRAGGGWDNLIVDLLDFEAVEKSQSGAQKYVVRPGFDGRFDVFNVGVDDAAFGFKVLAPLLIADIRFSLAKYQPGFALGKIDVVGHSMGAVLSRKITNENAQVRSAVRKLITINSPLGGTPLADKVVELRNKGMFEFEKLPLALDFIGKAAGELFTASGSAGGAWDVMKCGALLQIGGKSSEFNLFGGAVDDLQSNLFHSDGTPTETGELVRYGAQVPTHHVTTITTSIGDGLTGDLAWSLEVDAMWAVLGAFCNLTPDSTTVEVTELKKARTEIVLTALGLFRTPRAPSAGVSRSLTWTRQRKHLLDLLQGVAKERAGNAIEGDPVPVFSNARFREANDRVVPERSQVGTSWTGNEGGLPAGHAATTVITGKTDHQAAKITKLVPVELCIGTTVAGPGDIRPRIRDDYPLIPDLNFDGKPDPTCRVIRLLEEDPGSPLFHKSLPLPPPQP